VFLSFLLYYTKSSSTDANVITAFSKITLNCKKDMAMNVKSVMSFGLEMVGFGAKTQNTFHLDKSVLTTTLPSLVPWSTLLLHRNSTTLSKYNLLSSITIRRPHHPIGHGDINKTI
jgi:hypothetical protein